MTMLGMCAVQLNYLQSRHFFSEACRFPNLYHPHCVGIRYWNFSTAYYRRLSFSLNLVGKYSSRSRMNMGESTHSSTANGRLVQIAAARKTELSSSHPRVYFWRRRSVWLVVCRRPTQRSLADQRSQMSSGVLMVAILIRQQTGSDKLNRLRLP